MRLNLGKGKTVVVYIAMLFFFMQVHLFVDRTMDEFDDLSFKLPLMQQNGDNAHIVTKSVQKLDVYINNFAPNTKAAKK